MLTFTDYDKKKNTDVLKAYWRPKIGFWEHVGSIFMYFYYIISDKIIKHLIVKMIYKWDCQL